MKTSFIFFMVFGLIQNSFADEFDGVKCASDIPQALIGKKIALGGSQKIEKKHKAIGLKDLGADGLSDDPYSISAWRICGKEHVFLIDQKSKNHVIADVIVVPEKWASLPRILPGDSCVRQGEKVLGDIYAIIDENGVAKKAWRIDQEKMKWAEIAIDNLHCDKN